MELGIGNIICHMIFIKRLSLQSAAFDQKGYLYLTGSNLAKLDFTNYGDYDPFLIKLDTLGKKVWARQYGTTSNDYGRKILIDSKNDIYIVEEQRVILPSPIMAARMYLL